MAMLIEDINGTVILCNNCHQIGSLSSSFNNSNSMYLMRFWKMPRKVFIILLRQRYIFFEQIDDKANNNNILGDLKNNSQ